MAGRSEFSERFKQFSRFGDTNSTGKQITLSQSDKWMRQAEVIDGKTITTTDTAILFKKLRALKIDEREYVKFVEDLAKSKKLNADEIKRKMSASGPPRLSTMGAPFQLPTTIKARRNRSSSSYKSKSPARSKSRTRSKSRSPMKYKNLQK